VEELQEFPSRKHLQDLHEILGQCEDCLKSILTLPTLANYWVEQDQNPRLYISPIDSSTTIVMF
jgi:hypothetical protein